MSNMYTSDAMNTQVKKYGPVPVGKHRKSLERGSSIFTGKFSDFFRWFPTSSCRKVQEIDWNLPEKNPKNFRSEYCFHFRLFPVLSCRIRWDPVAVIFDLGSGFFCNNNLVSVCISKQKPNMPRLNRVIMILCSLIFILVAYCATNIYIR
jgi:hypothetical protein